MKKKSLTTVLSMVLLFCLFLLPGMKTNAAEAAKGGTVYASVEKFTIGQGYLIEPTAVEFKAGDTYADIFRKVLKDNGYQFKEESRWGGFYLTFINKADSGKVQVPECIQKMDGYKQPDMTMTLSDKALGEGSYTGEAGWMAAINGESAPAALDQCYPKNDDVVKFQFSLCGWGADLGMGYGITLPNRDSITKKLAIMKQNPDYKQNASWVAAYNQAIAVTSNLNATQAQLTAAEDKLPTATQITTWAQEQAQKKAEEAAKQALIKKNTPAKTTLKKTKKVAKNKVQLTWKKVKKATGYEVYQSTKKNGTYKKVKTVKKTKVVSYKTKSLKKKKTYYFKVRTYRKVAGKTYYGAFSNVKKVKMK